METTCGALLLALLVLPLGVAAQSYTRTEVMTYHDNTSKWVLGQMAKVTCVAPTTALPTGCGASGTVISEVTYDPTYALPLTTKSFGKLQETLTYDTTSTVISGQLGTLKTVKDGNNNVTTVSSWKRGIPQNIKYPITPESPTGAVQSVVVNNNGWIDSVTDEAQAKNCYTYDSMGRLASITYPSETTLGACDTAEAFWKKTNSTFQPVAVAEYGIPAGHWRQITTTGNANKITYFDALWRPLVTKELDATSTTTETLTKRFQRMAYDESGRIAFVSYPGTTDALTTGTWTDYDALGRVTSVSQDSELGLLNTLTTYSSDATGPYTRTTNPRLVQTVTRYQMFDQPSYDFPVLIDQAQNLPERVGIDIARDVFGKPLSIRKRNSANTVSLTRSYTYNSAQELCRTVEPETGATLMGYDGAGNLAWSAAGLPAGTACHTTGLVSPIQERRAARTYDARNRVKTLSFPDGLGNTTSSYTPDGLLASIAAQNGSNLVTTSYLYNKRRLAISERMQWGDIDWPVSYGYNANGHLSSQSWHGLTVDYAPNALGQPSKAGVYATGASYHPNGALKQFTYGNGIVHTMTQNARQLPSRSTDCKLAGTCAAANRVLDLGYAFDPNANVGAITDYTAAAKQTRGMTYDGLDRLTQTTSVPFGTASYTYDVLDNLTRVTVGASNQVAARDHFYCYGATTKRLDFVRNTSCSGGAVIALDYDEQGNLKNKNNRLHTFDFGNRLRSFSIAGIPTASYVYDGHGRRVRDYTTASKYSQYTQSGQLSMTSDGRANKVTEYVYLGGSLVATRERDVATGIYTVNYQHTDALGSPIAVTNASKTVIQTSEFEPYGKVVSRAEVDGPSYTGHVQDASSGLTYMQQRYYDPMIGRFLSVDPVTASSIGENFNRYWYADNNPYAFTDPDGRQSVRGETNLCNSGGGAGCDSHYVAGQTSDDSSVGETKGFATSQAASKKVSYEPLYCDGGADCDFMYNQREALNGNITMDEFNERTVAQGKGGAVGAVSAVLLVGSVEYGGIAFAAGARGLFGKGGFLNSGPNLRVGIGRDGGQSVARVAGNWLRKIPEPMRKALGFKEIKPGVYKWDLWSRGGLNGK